MYYLFRAEFILPKCCTQPSRFHTNLILRSVRWMVHIGPKINASGKLETFDIRNRGFQETCLEHFGWSADVLLMSNIWKR